MIWISSMVLLSIVAMGIMSLLDLPATMMGLRLQVHLPLSDMCAGTVENGLRAPQDLAQGVLSWQILRSK